ncbi:Concanavalin A-like lectin/glucanases superfamily, partial [Penicillium canariense]
TLEYLSYFESISNGERQAIRPHFNILFGEASVARNDAPGPGIVSSIALKTDNLDGFTAALLVDGDTTHIETKFFRKGDTTSYICATWATNLAPGHTFHIYKVTWTKETIVWSSGDQTVRTLAYDDAKYDTKYQQIIMNSLLGIWARGNRPILKE